MTELEPRREFKNQEPFVIRGHHLMIFRRLNRLNCHRDALFYLRRPLSPRKLAENIRSSLETKPTEYAQDVLGPSSRTADRTEKYFRRTFERFLSLPDDHPAEIVEGTPDIICKGCAFGNHCRSIDFPDGSNAFKEDEKYLDEFIEGANYLYLPNPTITREKAFFSDAETREARRIKTTIHVVKKVLASTHKPFFFC